MNDEITCNQCELTAENFYKYQGDVLCESCMDNIVAAMEAMED